MSGSKEGCLEKQDAVDGWKKHWCTVQDHQFRYTDDRRGGEFTSIDVTSIASLAQITEGGRQGFRIIVGDAAFSFLADSSDECESWIRALTFRPRRPPRPTLEDYTIIKRIGRGSFATVELVRSRIDGKVYAMKLMDKRVLQETDQVEKTIVERDLYFKLRHPFTVGAHPTFQTPESIVMILEYVPGGELFGRLRDESPFTESRMRLYAAELALAVGHLHANGILYRDLKPENILIDAQGHLKITDFGLVKVDTAGDCPTGSTFCGSPEYVAPEMLRHNSYTRAVDWWSYGLVVFEMITGHSPFYHDNVVQMYRKILTEPISFVVEPSRVSKDFILKLLDRNPATRLGAAERDVEDVKEHPFFRGLSWEKVLNREYEPEWIPDLRSEQDTRFFDEQDFCQQTEDLTGILVLADTQEQFQGFTQTEESVLDGLVE
jgi:serine/threonine protein kinase